MRSSDTNPPPLSRPGRWPIVLALLAAATLAALWLLWERRPRLSEAEVREAVYTTIQREAPESFYVTGWLELTATTTAAGRTVLLPGILDLGVSRTSTTVRVPARASYGVDVGGLRPETIRLVGDSLVVVTLPDVELYSVEPNLSELRVRTERGWVRLPGGVDPNRLERRALARVEQALRRQAEAHLRTSVQPRVNTARALERLLLPVLEATGMEEPRLEFRLGSGVVVGPER